MNIQIGLDRDIDRAREIIQSYFSDRRIKIEEKNYDFRSIFNIDFVKSKSLKEIYNRVANMILDLILNIYSKDIIYKQLGNNFNEFNGHEKRQIVEISSKILLDKNNFLTEKEYINNQIKRHIMDIPSIFIDGFIRFRLRELDFFINLVIDKGIEEFTAEKEYREFIKILQYFVDVQEPKYNLVNLFFEENDFKLLDERNNEINKDFFREILSEIDHSDIGMDDILISTLIVIAPKHLIIHLDGKDEEEDVIKIITNVFRDRVYFCLGCDKCNNRIRIKKR